MHVSNNDGPNLRRLINHFHRRGNQRRRQTPPSDGARPEGAASPNNASDRTIEQQPACGADDFRRNAGGAD